MSDRFRQFLLSLAVVALFAPAASASVARAVPFEEKVDAADAIVLGRIVSTSSAWDATGRWIVTRSTLQVEKAIKGTPAPEITLVTPGGSVDGVRQETVGVPSFAPGDEHVVFVRSTPAGPTVAFFEQGLLDVTRDGRGNITVEPAATDLLLIDRGAVRAAASVATAPESLASFERRVSVASRASAQRRLDMAAGAAVEPDAGSALSRFAREHRMLLAALSTALLLALAALLRKRP